METIAQDLALHTAERTGVEATAQDRLADVVLGEGDVIERRGREDAAGSMMVDGDCDGLE
jgi:hypothetical protein